MGIYNTDEMQINFSDTPGVLKPNYKLQESMLNSPFGIDGLVWCCFMWQMWLRLDKHMSLWEGGTDGRSGIAAYQLMNDLSNQEKLVELVEAWKNCSRRPIIPISATSEV